MTRLTLYTTEGCHLCEQAEAMLAQLVEQGVCEVEAVDIVTDEALVDRYGIRIPVVRNRAAGREIGWPFQMVELLSLV